MKQFAQEVLVRGVTANVGPVTAPSVIPEAIDLTGPLFLEHSRENAGMSAWRLVSWAKSYEYTEERWNRF